MTDNEKSPWDRIGEIGRQPKWIHGAYLVEPSGRIIRIPGLRGAPYRVVGAKPAKSGYKTVQLMIDGRFKLVYVHRLIAEVFLGPPPSRSHLVRHLDGDRHNNDVSNLRWGTAQENADDRERHGRTSRGPRLSYIVRQAAQKTSQVAALEAAVERIKRCQCGDLARS